MTTPTTTPTAETTPILEADVIDRLMRAGQFADARPMLERLCRQNPYSLPIRHALGVTLAQLGDFAAAAEELETVLKGVPKEATVHVDLGNVYRALQRHDDAVHMYRAAIALLPNFAEAHYNLALALRDVGDEGQAVQALKRAVMFKPQHALAHCTLGQILADIDPEQAGSSFRQALAAEKNMLAAQIGLIFSLAQLGRFDEAQRVLAKALKAHPDNTQVLRQKALVHLKQGELAGAEETYRQILQLSPDAEDVWLNLGSVYQMQGNNARAQEVLGNALRNMANTTEGKRNPNLLNALANLRVHDNDLAAAEALMQEAIASAPHSAPLSASFGRVLLARGDIAGAIVQYRKAVTLAPHVPELFSNLVYAQHLDPSLTPAERFATQKEWDTRFASSSTKNRSPINPNPERRLRIGLVSGDFRLHPVARGLLPLLTHYNRQQLEIFAYSTSHVEDPSTIQIKAQVDHWRPSAALPPVVLAGKIARDGIDILIDLSGHTAGNRLTVFANRAAPIQMTWLGFFSSSGVAAMDYRISDVVMDPFGKTTPWHTESLLYLPAPFCYLADPDAPDIKPLPAATQGFITFGALTHFNRVNPSVLKSWEPIFRALPSARLKIFSGFSAQDTASMARITEQLAAIGMEPTRFDIIPWLEYAEFLDQVCAVDIALDPFPYPGGMTTMDALWMGVPTITLAGQSSFERAGASLMTLAKLPELIATDTEQYTQIAIDIASKVPWLAEVRAGLRNTLQATPLLDGQAFATAFEEALRRTWHTSLGVPRQYG